MRILGVLVSAPAFFEQLARFLLLKTSNSNAVSP
jgi:hypothetical protein